MSAPRRALQLAGQQLWEVAQKLANDSLDAMRAAFETEKLDLAERREIGRASCRERV